MSIIKIAALGGMAENGKNMYVVNVDEQIFILDAGLIYPEVDLYGVDAVIPNIDYLIENKDKIQGIFISHGHEDHIGALPYLLKNINVRVYGTHFTISLIEELLTINNMNVKDYRLFRINDNKTLKFGNVSVSFFNVTHSLPESANIVLKTEDGNIVYAPDFNYSRPLNDHYKTSYEKLLELSKQKVLCVMAESIGATDTVRATSDQLFDATISSDVTHSKGNIYVVGYSSDLARMQKIASTAISYGKKIAVVGRKGEQIVNMAIKTNYLDVPQDKIVTLDKENSNLVVFVVGTYTEPYYLLSRLINNQIKNCKINKDDLFIALSDPIAGTEKYALHVLDEVYQKDLNFQQIEKKSLRSTHATCDDLVQLYSITKPKYYIPVKGEERHLHRHVELLKSLKVSEDNIISINDSCVACFVNGKFDGYEEIKTGKIYVDGTLAGSVNDEIVNERISLASFGVIEIVTYVDSKEKKIVKEPNIITKGFVYTKFDEKQLDLIKELVTKLINNALLKKKFATEEIENAILNEVKKLVFRLTKNETTILPVVIDLKNIKY